MRLAGLLSRILFPIVFSRNRPLDMKKRAAAGSRNGRAQDATPVYRAAAGEWAPAASMADACSCASAGALRSFCQLVPAFSRA